MCPAEVFEKIIIDPDEARRHLDAGRIEAAHIIAAMKEKGVTVSLFGSMKTGNVFPTSDIDLLVTDCGVMAPELVLYEIYGLAGVITLDVTILDFVTEPTRALILESLNG
jgi:predicted nucleotidyltransferase